MTDVGNALQRAQRIHFVSRCTCLGSSSIQDATTVSMADLVWSVEEDMAEAREDGRDRDKGASS